MQTFLPYKSYVYCVSVLDDSRLNKQIVEAWQIYTGKVPNPNHPACLMWADHKPELGLYIFAACNEYEVRTGKRHSIKGKLLADGWSGADEPFFAPLYVRISHTVNLLRKGVSVEELTRHLQSLMGRPCGLEEFPDGYYWPQSVGTKAKNDTENWKAFFKRNMI